MHNFEENTARDIMDSAARCDDFHTQAYSNLQIAQRTKPFKAAHAEFITHMGQDDEVVEVKERASSVPEGLMLLTDDGIPVARIFATAKAVEPGGRVVHWALHNGPAPYEHTYLWAKYSATPDSEDG